MGLVDELKKLDDLRNSGALTDVEFEQAKRQLLSGTSGSPSFVPQSEDNSLGRAANRFVSFQMIMSAIGLIAFLIFLFTFFLPRFLEISGHFGP